ncbi:MAG: hypothetical protein P1P82_11635 [Bacteroidales bacterium]|nr:hypothetical protein [Bacteroidales bacterium]MDT8432457.1 hypothetical protein [Bacteroidales bacterium]
MALNARTVLIVKKLPGLTVLLISLIFLATNFTHHSWTRTNPGKRGVIKHDVNMYYAYLTAGIIEKDLTLEFMSEPGFDNQFRYWNTRAENGNRIIITSMGLAFMYAPFFFMAHLVAHLSGLPTDGYGSIYQFFLVFGGLVYVILALLILRRLLIRIFDPVTTSITLVLVAIGTNLYYYSTYEAAMPHVYNFFLVTLFTRQVIRWYRHPGWKNALLIGGLLGLISLIRPTNILVFFILFLWDVKSLDEFRQRIIFFLQRYYLVLLMLAAFLLVWTPQMLYWKMITGQFLYFSYGVAGASFYFASPQIFGSLFSFIKGWYVYTPVMLFATIGILLLHKRYKTSFLPVLVLFLTMVYVQSSWWSWWFGGGFGLRAYIDIYAVMAFPLAALVEKVVGLRTTWKRVAGYAVMIFLVYLSWHQTYQYHKGMIHYCGMTKESYMLNFLKYKSAPGYWSAVRMPDHQLARQGIYYYYDTTTNDEFREMQEAHALEKIITQLKSDNRMNRQVARYAEREGLGLEEAYEQIATRIYNMKTD